MTYSIVARDPETGELGAAVQSHYLGTGAVVTWAQAGVGAVATQAMAEIGYGPRVLARLRRGQAAGAALQAELAADDGRALRQVAVVDGDGAVAVHTGDRCIAEAGHVHGDGWSVQANMMWRPTVWPAMAESFHSSKGDLAERLLAALYAGEAAGGDIRGRQSAALVVVPPEGQPWERTFDLRVDDHRDPLGELDRLLQMRRAYRAGRHQAVMGTNPELLFWTGVQAASEGRLVEARSYLAEAYRAGEGWRELVRRLPAAGLLPEDPGLVAELTAADQRAAPAGDDGP